MKTYTVTDLANFSGVSVRALHHYDHLGLLSPAERMEGGKRVYNRESLYQLQQILFYKEAGFSLQEIGELLLESPDDKIARLKQQKNRILDKRQRMNRLLNTIESTINALKNQNGMMNEQELYAGFSKEETAEMRKEVAERWGADTLEESETRLKKKTPAEFKRLKEAGENIVQRMAQSMNLPIDHPEVQQLVMEYFEHQQEFRAIDKEQYSHLGQLYVEDERFTAYYEKHKEGLSKFVSDAIAYFCKQHLLRPCTECYISTRKFGSMAANTIDEVIGALDAIIQHSTVTQSRLGYFAALYRRVTVAVKKGISEGYFDDGEAMERLDVIFANRYLDAYEARQSNRNPTHSWQVAFEAAQRWPPLVIQHLFVGMNAHISLDLGIAAFEAYGDDLERLKPDFMKINDVLMSLVGTVQHELASFWPIMKWVDWIGGKMDEELAGFAMDYARDRAWDFAIELKNNNQLVALTIADRDLKVAAFGQKLVTPGIILSTIIAVLKLTEKGNIQRKIGLLNAPTLQMP